MTSMIALPQNSRMTIREQDGIEVISLHTTQEELEYRSSRTSLTIFLFTWLAGEAFAIWALAIETNIQGVARWSLLIGLFVWSLMLIVIAWHLILSLRPYRPDQLLLGSEQLVVKPGTISDHPFFGGAHGFGFLLGDLVRFALGETKQQAFDRKETGNTMLDQEGDDWTIDFRHANQRIPLPIGTSADEAKWVVRRIQDWHQAVNLALPIESAG